MQRRLFRVQQRDSAPPVVHGHDPDDYYALPETLDVMCVRDHPGNEVSVLWRRRSCYSCKQCGTPKGKWHLCKESGCGPWQEHSLEKAPSKKK